MLDDLKHYAKPYDAADFLNDALRILGIIVGAAAFAIIILSLGCSQAESVTAPAQGSTAGRLPGPLTADRNAEASVAALPLSFPCTWICTQGDCKDVRNRRCVSADGSAK